MYYETDEYKEIKKLYNYIFERGNLDTDLITILMEQIENYVINVLGEGKITKKQYDKILNFMYQWSESTYNYEDGFDNYMSFIYDAIHLILDK